MILTGFIKARHGPVLIIEMSGSERGLKLSHTQSEQYSAANKGVMRFVVLI